MTIVVTPDDRPIEIGPGRGDLRQTSVPLAALLHGPYVGGRPVSYANIFLTQQWVAIAVMRMLSWSIRVPLKLYRRIDDENVQRIRPDEHPLAAALVNPWGVTQPGGSQAELVTSILGPFLVHGNQLLDVDQGRDDKIRFECIDWRMVTPKVLDEQDPNSPIQGWKISKGLDEYTRSADRVMHLRWWSPFGPTGISPLEHLRSTVANEDAATRWALNRLGASRPSGVIESSDEFLTMDAGERAQLMAQLRDDLDEIWSGPENAGRSPVLPPGLKWSNPNFTTAVEAELVNQRLINRNEIAAIYMVPPPMIAQLDKATYSNIEVQREMAYTDGLAPPLILCEQKINAHLIRDLLREDDIFVQFDFGHVLRGDRLKEITALRQSIGSAMMTPNEAREVLNLPKSDEDGADKLWLPQNNLVPLGERPKGRETDKADTEPTEPTPTPEQEPEEEEVPA